MHYLYIRYLLELYNFSLLSAAYFYDLMFLFSKCTKKIIIYIELCTNAFHAHIDLTFNHVRYATTTDSCAAELWS